MAIRGPCRECGAYHRAIRVGRILRIGAEKTEGFQSGDVGGAVVKVEMGIDEMQPACGLLDDVVGVEVEDNNPKGELAVRQ